MDSSASLPGSCPARKSNAEGDGIELQPKAMVRPRHNCSWFEAPPEIHGWRKRADRSAKLLPSALRPLSRSTRGSSTLVQGTVLPPSVHRRQVRTAGMDGLELPFGSLNEVLEDLASRFILNLPPVEMNQIERICFQVEQAHWFYEDFIRPNTRLELPSYSLKAFTNLFFSRCAFLRTGGGPLAGWTSCAAFAGRALPWLTRWHQGSRLRQVPAVQRKSPRLWRHHAEHKGKQMPSRQGL